MSVYRPSAHIETGSAPGPTEWSPTPALGQAALHVLAALGGSQPVAALLALVGEQTARAARCDCLVSAADADGRLTVQWASTPRELSPALHFDHPPAPRHGHLGGEYYACAPLTVAGRLAGGLHLLRAEPFTPPERRWLSAIAGQLSSRLERAADEQRLAQQLTHLQIALQSGGAGSPDMERLLSGAMRSLAEALQADSCSLVLADLSSGQLIVDAAHGLNGRSRGKARLGEGIASYVIRSGRPMLINDPRRDPRLAGLHFTARPGIISSICVPIEPGANLAGVVSINRRKGKLPFAEADLRLAASLAGQLTPCVQNAILYQRSAAALQEMSTVTRLAGAMAATLEVPAVCRLVAEAAAELAGARACTIYLAEGEELKSPSGEPVPEIALQCRQTARPVGEGDERCLPVAGPDGVVAVAHLRLPADSPPAETGLGLLGGLLEGAAVAIQNALAHQQLRRHLSEMNLVYQGLARISASLRPERVLAELAAAGAEVIGGNRVLLALPAAAWGDTAPPPARAGMRLHWLKPGGADGRLIARLRSARLVEVRRHPVLVAALRDWHSPYAVVAPLRSGQLDLGAVVFPVAEPVPAGRLDALSTLAQHAARIAQQALDYQDAALQQPLEVSALYQLCERISHATSFEGALDALLDIVATMVDFDDGAVYLRAPDGDDLRLTASRGADRRGPADPELCAWVAHEGKAFLSSTALESPGQVSTLMAVPLVLEQRCLGVLAVRSAARTRPYGEDQVKLVSIVGAQAAAIYQALQSLGTLQGYTDNILHSMVTGIVGVDQDGIIVMWNRAAERILGHSAAEATGRPLDQVMDEISRRRGPALTSISLLVRRLAASDEPAASQTVQAGDLVLSVSCSPLAGPTGPAGYVLALEDVTERVRMEERVARMNQLAAVGHLAANVAHEIRNPISAIKTAAQFMRNEYRGEELIDQFSGIINEECDRLTKTTTDFLTFARPSAPDLRPTDLLAVLNRTASLLGPEAERQGVRLDCRLEPLPELLADPDELQQVFLNLVNNALQALDGAGRVVLTARPAPDGGALVEVADNGCGIPAEHLADVFKPFFTTKTQGTGLGLAIVRKIVEAHGGRVTIDSRPGRGTTVSVVLPAAGQAPEGAGPAALPSLERPAAPGQLDLFLRSPGD